jgi:phospholipid transport system transporter-binding protein
MSDLKLPASLIHAQANACLTQWVAQLKAQPLSTESVQVDVSALQDFDSSALAVLLGLRRELMASGRQLVVLGMTARLRELATLYGVVDLLEST